MHGEAGKGSKRRPMQISYDQWAKNYALATGKNRRSRSNKPKRRVKRGNPT